MDNVAAAVAAVEAAAEAAPKPVTMTVLEGAFGDSGRPFGISVPADISEAEAYALVELITKIRQQAFASQATSSRIVDLAGRRLPRS
jgi:hypothetical protein